jgi:hypothetical protein
VARPTEPRDSYASGIWIPHSSPSVKSNSRSDKRSCYRTSPNARVENDFRAFSTISITESCKGRPSRGTPTPPGYGYLTHHLPRKVTLARISDSATDEQVLILETRGKETQLYSTTLRCLGLSGRKKHTHTTDKLFLQVQTSAGGATAPSATFPPSAEPGPASDGDTGGRISTPREDASTALGPS